MHIKKDWSNRSMKSLRLVCISLCLICVSGLHAQNPKPASFDHDSVLIVKANPLKGFNNDYILFIPRNTPQNKRIHLLVEPNNTGKITDTMDVHLQAAINLASKSSVGNNVSTVLGVPLLVPVFPRPASAPLMYTHALDRDVMLSKMPAMKRPDLQLVSIIDDARNVLASLNIVVAEKVLMSGFSASATFTNRFSLLHPELIQALAIGGFNGELMLPQSMYAGERFDYPLGTNDFEKITGRAFDSAAFKAIPQFLYMGALDENDAVQFDDAYNDKERKIINAKLGSSVQVRFLKCQEIFRLHNVNVEFRIYDSIGHWTTGKMNLNVAKFFAEHITSD
jgi:hypothetical protein